MKTQPEPLINAKQVATHLSINKATVYKWAKQGKIPYYMLAGAVRFKLSEIEKYIQSVRCAAYSELV